MPKHFLICLFFFLCFRSIYGQNASLIPLNNDPTRAEGLQAARIQSQDDTLSLPFFEDFSSADFPIASVSNVFGQPVEIFTSSPHGHHNGSFTRISETLTDTDNDFINGGWYIERTSPLSFRLYLDRNLNTPLTGSGESVPEPGLYTRANYNLAPLPDPRKWIQGGGTYINNRYPADPPSINVATFDGLRESGAPYSTFPLSHGLADNLTSLPIDLSSLTAEDSVYMSFFWQSTGHGETSDYIDSLRLQFKNSAGQWITQWSRRSDSAALANSHHFLQVMIPVLNPAFFHNHFQFRFQSFGRLSGSFDIWNVDYIYLNRNRTSSNLSYPDAAPVRFPSSFLKDYSAMPVNQYFLDRSKTADSVYFSVRNVGLPKAPNYSVYFDDQLTETLYDNFNLPGNVLIVPYEKAMISWTPDDSPITSQSDPLRLRYFVKLHTADTIVNDVDYRINDVIFSYTDLIDYYAYDDGSAEFGFGVNQTTGKIANRFHMDLQDTLTHIDIYFPQMLANLNNLDLDLMVWTSLTPGTNDEIAITRQRIRLSYTEINKIKRYELHTPLVLSGTFYIGFQQFTNQFVPVGWDRNNDARENVFYFVHNQWNQYTDEAGSLMIRPVFYKGFITGIEKPRTSPAELECKVYPNPAGQEINIAGQVKKVSIYDISGKLMLEKEFTSEGSHVTTLYLTDIPNGMYFMHISDGKLSTVKKIIVSK